MTSNIAAHWTVFFQSLWGKPNAPTISTFVRISRILSIFTYFDTLIMNVIVKIADQPATKFQGNLTLIALKCVILHRMYHQFFRKLSIVGKNVSNKKYISRWGPRIILGTFCEILQSRNFFNSMKLFFERIAMHKFIWFDETFFWVYQNAFKSDYYVH